MDVDKAMLDPTSVFTFPEEVLDEESLSKEQKIQILRRWEYDARELEVAEEENMGGTSPSLLGEIVDALHKLNVGLNTEHSFPTKHGGE